MNMRKKKHNITLIDLRHFCLPFSSVFFVCVISQDFNLLAACHNFFIYATLLCTKSWKNINRTRIKRVFEAPEQQKYYLYDGENSVKMKWNENTGKVWENEWNNNKIHEIRGLSVVK